jgi:hypothetical protein
MGVVAGTAPDHTSCNVYCTYSEAKTRFGTQSTKVRTYLHRFLFDKFGHLVTDLSTVLYGYV